MKYIYIILVFVFISCTNETTSIESNNSSKKITSLEEYQNFLYDRTKTNGNVLITSDNTMASLAYGQLNNYQISTKNDENYPVLVTLDDKTFSSSSKNTEENLSSEDISSFFGKKINLKIINKGSIVGRTTSLTEKTTTYTNDIYIPKTLESSVEETITEDTSEKILVAGSKLIWNADINNERGMVITLKYFSSLQAPVIREANPEDITYWITSEDNGSYVIKKSDLTPLPDNSYIDITIMRIGFGIVPDDSTAVDMSFAAMTQISTSILIKK